MKREKRGLNPVWLVFVAPGLARGWLLFHTTPGSDGAVSWLALAINASLLLALLVLTWHFAADLADAAGLWQRAKERFLVMATLCALAPPLSIAVAQTSHLGSFTAVEVLSLWLLKLSFRLLAHKPVRMVRRERWFARVLCCLLCAAGLRYRRIILHAMFLAIPGLYLWSQLCTYMLTGSTPLWNRFNIQRRIPVRLILALYPRHRTKAIFPQSPACTVQ